MTIGILFASLSPFHHFLSKVSILLFQALLHKKSMLPKGSMDSNRVRRVYCAMVAQDRSPTLHRPSVESGRLLR